MATMGSVTEAKITSREDGEASPKRNSLSVAKKRALPKRKSRWHGGEKASPKQNHR